MSLSLVLPTYEEAESISRLLNHLLAIPEVDEILVVDDDSPDRTWEVAGTIQSPRLRVIRRVGERGLTSALNRGIQEAKGELVAWMDADGAMPADLIPSLLSAKQHADIAIGSRYVPGGRDRRPSSLRRFSSRLINRIARLVLGTTVRDCTTGFVLAERAWVLQNPLQGNYGDYCIRFLVHADRSGLRVAEVPFENFERRMGRSKTKDSFLSFCRIGFGYLKAIWQLR